MPTIFSKPGLSAPVRVNVVTVDWQEDCRRTRRVVQRSPDSIELSATGVVNVVGGTMVAAASGRVQARVFAESALCGEVQVSVHEDLEGTWSGKCEGGDEGSVTLGPMRGSFITNTGCPSLEGLCAPRHGGYTMASQPGTSRFCGLGGYSCMDAAVWRLGTNSHVVSPRDGPCSVVGCGVGLPHCAKERHPGAGTLKGNSITTEGCSFKRGGTPPKCEDAGDSGECVSHPVCAGVTLNTCARVIPGSATCWHDVNGTRIECGRCDDSAAVLRCGERAATVFNMMCMGRAP